MIEEITLKGGAKVFLDEKERGSKCKKCGKKMYWAITEKGKKMPICKDKDGAWISHFADCFAAAHFRKDDRLADLERQKEREKFQRGNW